MLALYKPLLHSFQCVMLRACAARAANMMAICYTQAKQAARCLHTAHCCNRVKHTCCRMLQQKQPGPAEATITPYIRQAGGTVLSFPHLMC